MNDEDEQEMFDWGDDKYEDRCLDLCGKDIGAKDVGDFLKSLGDELREVSTLKIVDLADNRVGAQNENMGPIHRLLMASSTSLTALNLSSNPLGEDQRHAGPLLELAATLQGLSRLKVLDLSECTLIGRFNHRYKGLIALGDAFAGWKNRLTHLRLCGNSLHSEAALVVAGWFRAVPKLRYLDISRNPLATDTLGQRSRGGFDPFCGSLRNLAHLRTLRLGYCGLDDGEAEAVACFLASSPRLEHLDLSSNQIHVRGARRLAGALRSNGSLISLLMGNNPVGDTGGKLLALAIPYACSFEELDVSSCRLTDKVKEAFIQAALASTTISTYGLAGNDILPADEEAMRSHAAANIELRKVIDDPEGFDLWTASAIVEESLLAKFDRMPQETAEKLKRNPTFMEADGPMRETVLRACPPSKSELLRRSPGAVRAARKANKVGIISGQTDDSTYDATKMAIELSNEEEGAAARELQQQEDPGEGSAEAREGDTGGGRANSVMFERTTLPAARAS